MNIRKIEQARRLAAKIAAQQNVSERVTGLLGTPSIWVNSSGRNYEWVIPATTLDRLAVSLRRQLEALGCTLFNVDSSRDPYYWVCVRYVEA